MQVEETPLKELLLIKPQAFPDARGFFLETYDENYLPAGIDWPIAQINHSRSTKDVVRGLHFQSDPGQAKLVYCARGAVWDVAVDLRKNSPTYSQWHAEILSDDNHHQLYLPVGFGHGFCVLTDEADFFYCVSTIYNGATETGIAWDDQDVNIQWPTKQPQISDRDQKNPLLRDYDWSNVTWQTGS